MNKNELYGLYKTLNVSNEEITSVLEKMVELKGIDAHLFYITCINNSDVLTDDNFYDIFNIFLNLCYFSDVSNKMLFCNIFNDFIGKDYINSSEDFNDILTTITIILSYPINDVIYIEDGDSDYYILSFIKNYISLLNRNQYDYSTLYKHDFSLISTNYYKLLIDLPNTEMTDFDDFNKSILRRVELFVDIATSSRIINLDDTKYESVIEVATSINNLSELTKFKNRIKILSNSIPDLEFRKLIDTYTSELNSNTIKIIFDELQIQIKENNNGQKELIESDFSLDKQDDILRKILVSDSSTNIIKFQ